MPFPPGAARSLAVLFAINVLNFYDRLVPGALAEPIRKEFGLSDTQVGLLGTAFIWVYAIVGLPLGRLADRWSRKKLLAAGMVVWSALTALASLASNFQVLLFSRLGVGVGEAACAPAATSWIGDLFTAERRSRALALFMLGVPLGSALSSFLSGPTAQRFGWRAAMVLAALPAVVLTPALLWLREPSRGATDPHITESIPLARILRIPTLWWIIASGALVNFILYAIATFLPAFLSRVHGLTLARSGVATGMIYGSGGILGGLIAGSWGDRVFRKRKDGRMLSAAVAASLASGVALLAILQAPGELAATLLLFACTYGLLNMYYGFVYSSIHDLVPASVRGTTMAVYFLAMYFCGASFGPLLTGNLSDRMARRAAAAAGSGVVTETFRAAGLHQAMFIIPVLSLALASVLYAGSRTVVRDVERRYHPTRT